jgi:hypothetical protein
LALPNPFTTLGLERYFEKLFGRANFHFNSGAKKKPGNRGWHGTRKDAMHNARYKNAHSAPKRTIKNV